MKLVQWSICIFYNHVMCIYCILQPCKECRAIQCAVTALFCVLHFAMCYTMQCTHRAQRVTVYSVLQLHCAVCYIIQCVKLYSVLHSAVCSMLYYTVCYNYIAQCLTLYSVLHNIQYGIYSTVCSVLHLHYSV